MDETFDSSTPVHRVPLKPRGNGGALNLLLNYFSFVFNGLIYFSKSAIKSDADVIFVFAPSPISSVIPAIYLKWRLKKHLAVWVQDLWPESLSATGFIRNKYALSVVRLLVRGIYASVDTLLVQSRAFLKPISTLTDSEKVIYYPNSYLEQPRSLSDETTVPDDLISILDANFCIVFAGNLGAAQSLETIVDCATILRSDVTIKIVLVGSGSRLDWLKQQIAILGLENIVLAGRYDPVEMSIFFSRAAGLLVTLKKDEIFSYTIPSKIQAYLAAGRPIVAALDGEGSRIVAEAKAGFTCEAEDAEGLAKCIRDLRAMSDGAQEAMGRSAKNYFVKNFEMTQQCARLIEILHSRLQEQEI